MARFTRLLHCASVACACWTALLAAQTVTVGGDEACGYPSIQAAVDALPAAGEATIRVADTATYTAQAIAIDGRHLAIEGGYATCASSARTSETTLDGSGGARNSVITVTGTGNRIYLRGLRIVGGDETEDDDGGGVDFSADGTLYLSDVEISGNTARDGGGLAVRNYTSATATLGPNVRIIGNTALGSGGGILVEYGRLLAEADGILVAFNHAPAGHGGGIDVRYTTQVDIGSPGFGGLPVLYGNDAQYGGGLAVEAGTLSAYPALARLYTTDATRPVRIGSNSASATGGGVHLRPYFNVDLHNATATLCASDIRIDDNDAVQGAAIYADSDYSLANDLRASQVFINPPSSCDGTPARPASARSCIGRPDCNLIDANFARGDATPANGAVILLQNAGSLIARNLVLRGNEAGHLFRTFGGQDDETLRLAELDVSGCLAIANTLSREMFRYEGAGVLSTLEHCTIAGNTLAGPPLFRFSDGSQTRLTLRRSIVWQPGFDVRGGTMSGELQVASSLAHEFASLPGASDPATSDPRFIGAGDYRLRAASPAVDYAPASGSDLDGVPRNRDLPVKANHSGSGDLGAFERPLLLPLVLNAAFDADAVFWRETTPGVATWDATQNADGAAGSGSIQVMQESAPQVRVTGLAQCVHLPGPGTYALNGWGRSGAGPAANRDYLYLHWEYRHAGGEACTDGAPDLAGDHFLTNQNAWRKPSSPALVVVPESEWTTTSSIDITMVVAENGITSPPTTIGWFDGITLEPVLPDLIFADGFEP